MLPDSQAPRLLNSCSVSFNCSYFPRMNFHYTVLLLFFPIHKKQSDQLCASSIEVQLKFLKPSPLLGVSKSGMQKEQKQHLGGPYCVLSFVHVLQWLPFLLSSFTCFHMSLKSDFLSSHSKYLDHFLLASPNPNLGNVAGAFGALVFGFQHHLV